MRLPVPVVLVAVLATVLSACSGPPPSPRGTLSRYLAAWGNGDWAAMRRQVAGPPADFTAVNAAAFTALGVTHASFTAARITMNA